jgi:hypothetical protein
MTSDLQRGLAEMLHFLYRNTTQQWFQTPKVSHLNEHVKKAYYSKLSDLRRAGLYVWHRITGDGYGEERASWRKPAIIVHEIWVSRTCIHTWNATSSNAVTKRRPITQRSGHTFGLRTAALCLDVAHQEQRG